MSAILAEIDRVLAAFDSAKDWPIAIELGKRRYTQLVLDVAHLHAASGELTINTDRPLAYPGLKSLQNKCHVDRVQVI